MQEGLRGDLRAIKDLLDRYERHVGSEPEVEEEMPEDIPDEEIPEDEPAESPADQKEPKEEEELGDELSDAELDAELDAEMAEGAASFSKPPPKGKGVIWGVVKDGEEHDTLPEVPEPPLCVLEVASRRGCLDGATAICRLRPRDNGSRC